MANWYLQIGKDSDVVISTMVRLARNINGFNFENIASLLYASQVVTSVMEITNTDVLQASFGADVVEVDNTRGEMEDIDFNDDVKKLQKQWLI